MAAFFVSINLTVKGEDGFVTAPPSRSKWSNVASPGRSRAKPLTLKIASLYSSSG